VPTIEALSLCAMRGTANVLRMATKHRTRVHGAVYDMRPFPAVYVTLSS
jgi:hypothetical protein